MPKKPKSDESDFSHLLEAPPARRREGRGPRRRGGQAQARRRHPEKPVVAAARPSGLAGRLGPAWRIPVAGLGSALARRGSALALLACGLALALLVWGSHALVEARIASSIAHLTGLHRLSAAGRLEHAPADLLDNPWGRLPIRIVASGQGHALGLDGMGGVACQRIVEAVLPWFRRARVNGVMVRLPGQLRRACQPARNRLLFPLGTR